MPRVTTRDRDRGFARIVATLKDAARSEVAIGWFPDAMHGEAVAKERGKLERSFGAAQKSLGAAVQRAEQRMAAGKAASIALSRMAKLRESRRALEAHEQRHGRSLQILQTAAVATSHEFGLGVPPRPMLRPVHDQNLLRYRALIRNLFGRVVWGSLSIEGALVVIGSRIEADVKRWITSGPHEPLSDVTIQRKGSSRPLIDTGVMRDQVQFKYKVGGKVET